MLGVEYKSHKIAMRRSFKFVVLEAMILRMKKLELGKGKELNLGSKN
jgi:hypothetical protein